MFSRVAGAGLALVATALLAVAIATPVVLPPQLSLFAGHPTVSHRTREFQEAYIGLYRAELCNTGGDGSCRTGDTKPAYRNIAYGGIATTGFLAISTLMMAFAAIRNSERRRSAAIQVWIASALAAGTVGALFVVGPFPAASEASVPIGLGTAIYGGGIFAALVASLFAGRRAQPLKLRAPDRAPIVAARHRIAPQQNAAPANRGPARELPPRPFDAVPARPSPPRSFDAVPARPSPPRSFDAVPARPSPPRSFDAAVPRRSPPRAFDAPAPPFAGDREAEPFDEAIFDPAAARSQPVPVPAPRSSFNVDDLPTPPPALEDRAWTQMKASFGPRSKPPTLAPPIGEARAPMPGTPPTPMPGTPPAPPADVAASPPRVPPPLAPPEPMASSDADSSRESSESFFAAFAAAHLQPVQPVHPVQPVAPPPPAYAATAAPSAPTSTGFAAQPFPAASPFAPTSTGFPAPQPPSASSSSTFAPPQAPPFNAQAFAAPPPSAALQPAPQGTPQASAMPWASEAPAPSPPLARSASPTGAPPPARTPRETSPPAPPAPRPGRETLPPPAPAPPTRSARETAPPPARTPRETSPPPPPPRPARETLSPAAAPPPPARVVRDTQAPPPPARAARDSQSPLIPHAALAGEGPSAAKAASARAAVPMPERPTRSNPPTKPPLPLPNRGAPPRPGKSTVPPTFVIPPIPAVRPMPQVPVIPSRLDTEPVAPGSEPSTGVDLPMDDVTSTNNASFGNASPADATAATPRVEPPAAGGFKLETADTSPSGQPVGTAGHPPDLNGKRTTAPASSVAKPKLPISTAPDSLPPPSESELGGGPTPACPQCESPMGWVEEHLRFYCKSCRMYF